ncbi:hypothetical protein E1B28_009219 [Marasmius oreades]|uniref:Uncharacterized protein n=1 Tax=Marasmius oreades TaxID=181124 RepID=A0A9P7UV32_9AGAR|nr:uncharacterized protein E1B28_009219 [Marasmius oreades]KAG7092914.1 hypothetical protein E1B28_009219 [Marasmius oreades]
MHSITTMLIVSAGIQVAVGQTSLWIPGFDEQALSADVVGVDTAQGRTTYQIQRGASTAPTDDESGFTGTFTLVEGADYASYSYVQDGVSLVVACSISGSLGLCSGSDGSTTVTETETVQPFLVQGGKTLANTAPTGTPATNTGGGTPSGTTGTTRTTSNAPPSQTKNPNAALSSKQWTSAGMILGFMGMVFSFL